MWFRLYSHFRLCSPYGYGLVHKAGGLKIKVKPVLQGKTKGLVGHVYDSPAVYKSY